jgi:hypothetical protein
MKKLRRGRRGVGYTQKVTRTRVRTEEDAAHYVETRRTDPQHPLFDNLVVGPPSKLTRMAHLIAVKKKWPDFSSRWSDEYFDC